MHYVIGWLAANPYEALGLAYVALGALNAILPHKGDDASALRRLLDWLAPLVPAKFAGTLKPPLRASRPGDGPPVPPAVLVLVALALGGCGHEARGVGIVIATIMGAGACLALLAMRLAAFRARRLDDAAYARALCSRCGALRLPTPSMAADGTVYTYRDHCVRCGEVDISDEHARAMASAIEAKARRRAGIPPALALVALASLSGCSQWAAAGAIADGAKMAIGGYTIWYEAQADKVLAGADQCKGLVALDAAVCASKALAPLRAQQDPVLKCLPTAKPLVLAAAAAAEAHDDQAAKSLLPDLVEKVRPCVAAIKAAQKAANATPGGTP